MMTTAQEIQVLRKLQDAEDGGVPTSEIAEMVELVATEVEQTLHRLVSQGLVWTVVDASPARHGAQVSPLYGSARRAGPS